MTANVSALDQYVEQHVQESMQELARLCSQPSVSAQGRGIHECASLVADLLRSRGVAVQVMETAGHPVVCGAYGTGDRTLLLYNHYDVQPPEPLELWNSPPFEGKQRDGKFFARGALDDKGELISRLAAFDAVRAVYGELPYRVKFLIEGEEEIGSPSLNGFLRDHRELLAADACVWEAGEVNYEGRFHLYLVAGNLSGQTLKEAVFQPTCTINGLWSGYQGEGSKAIVPAEAGCKLDFRLAPGQDPEQIVRQLRAHLDAQGFQDIELLAQPGERAGVVDPDEPVVQLAIETARAVYGKEPIIDPLDGGSGPYALFLEHLHTPIIVVGVGYPGSLAHAPNEHIRISDWLLGTKHMAHIFVGFRSDG